MNLIVRPAGGAPPDVLLFLVLFEDAAPAPVIESAPETGEHGEPDAREQRIAALERDIHRQESEVPPLGGGE